MNTRILLISDFHWLTVLVGKQEGQATTGITGWIEKMFNIWKRWNIEKAIPRLMDKINLLEPYAGVFHNGDLTECRFNERGLVESSDIQETEKMKRRLARALSFSGQLRFVPGDHELGYRLPMSSDPQGGVSLKSLRNFTETLGPLFSLYKIKDIPHLYFLCLSSSLFSQSLKHLPPHEQKNIRKIREKQMLFLRETMKKADGKDKFVVLIHDPDSLEILENSLSHKDKEKIYQVFCGHLHASWALKGYAMLGRASFFIRLLHGQIGAWAKKNNDRAKLFRKYNLRVIPAPGGMLGIGAGFLILNVSDNGDYEIEEVRL